MIVCVWSSSLRALRGLRGEMTLYSRGSRISRFQDFVLFVPFELSVVKSDKPFALIIDDFLRAPCLPCGPYRFSAMLCDVLADPSDEGVSIREQ